VVQEGDDEMQSVRHIGIPVARIVVGRMIGLKPEGEQIISEVEIV
jgi:hypothetical protein